MGVLPFLWVGLFLKLISLLVIETRLSMKVITYPQFEFFFFLGWRVRTRLSCQCGYNNIVSFFQNPNGRLIYVRDPIMINSLVQGSLTRNLSNKYQTNLWRFFIFDLKKKNHSKDSFNMKELEGWQMRSRSGDTGKRQRRQNYLKD